MTVVPGSVCYLECVTPDPQALRDMYAAVCGWSFSSPVPELGGAFVAELPDGSRCGIRAPMHDQEEPVTRPYILVADLAAAVEAAREAQAEIMLESMIIPGRGTIAIVATGRLQHGFWELPA